MPSIAFKPEKIGTHRCYLLGMMLHVPPFTLLPQVLGNGGANLTWAVVKSRSLPLAREMFYTSLLTFSNGVSGTSRLLGTFGVSFGQVRERGGKEMKGLESKVVVRGRLGIKSRTNERCNEFCFLLTAPFGDTCSP